MPTLFSSLNENNAEEPEIRARAMKVDLDATNLYNSDMQASIFAKIRFRVSQARRKYQERYHSKGWCIIQSLPQGTWRLF
jgi:hypothetical protein